MQLGSGVAVAVTEAGSYSSDSTPSLGTSVCHGYGPKKTKDQNNENDVMPLLLDAHGHVVRSSSITSVLHKRKHAQGVMWPWSHDQWPHQKQHCLTPHPAYVYWEAS